MLRSYWAEDMIELFHDYWYYDTRDALYQSL